MACFFSDCFLLYFPYNLIFFYSNSLFSFQFSVGVFFPFAFSDLYVLSLYLTDTMEHSLLSHLGSSSLPVLIFLSSPSHEAEIHHQHTSQQLPVVKLGVSCSIAMLAVYKSINNKTCSDRIQYSLQYYLAASCMFVNFLITLV